MSTLDERKAKLTEEEAYKDHIHHTKINTAAVVDHVLANMHALHVKLQVLLQSLKIKRALSELQIS